MRLILKEQGIEPAPVRGKKTSWATFIKAHLGAIAAADFFTVEAISAVGLIRYHVFFLIDIATRKVEIAGIKANPGGVWIEQIARTPSTSTADSALGNATSYATEIRSTRQSSETL